MEVCACVCRTGVESGGARGHCSTRGMGRGGKVESVIVCTCVNR